MAELDQNWIEDARNKLAKQLEALVGMTPQVLTKSDYRSALITALEHWNVKGD